MKSNPGTILGKFKNALTTAGSVLAAFQARLLLFFVFYLIVTPIGLIWRVIGKDPMNKTWVSKSESYFKESEPMPLEHWERMF
ncbi:MAG: hypothetical protein AAF202_06580 [Pseudomonadota bacterium]